MLHSHLTLRCIHTFLLCFLLLSSLFSSFFFFFNDTATTEIYTLSLHDALPISQRLQLEPARESAPDGRPCQSFGCADEDRKSTRLNSSHVEISYAVFCLKKKKKNKKKKLKNKKNT